MKEMEHINDNVMLNLKNMFDIFSKEMSDNFSVQEKKISKEISEMSGKFSNQEKKLSKEISDNFSDLEKKLSKEMSNRLSDELSKVETQLRYMRGELDNVQEGGQKSMSPEFLVALLSQASSSQEGPQINQFTTGRSKKMQLLSNLNIGL